MRSAISISDQGSPEFASILSPDRTKRASPKGSDTQFERHEEAAQTPAVHPKGHPAKLPDGLFAALPQQVIARPQKLISDSYGQSLPQG